MFLSAAAAFFQTKLALAICCTLSFIALVAASFNVPILNRLLQLKSPDDNAQPSPILRFLILAFAVLTLFGTYVETAAMNVWLFTAPLLIFFFFEFKAAICIAGVYAVVSVAVNRATQAPLEAMAFTPSFILFIGIGYALVYLRELRHRQLKPLRQTDNLTLASAREHLEDDLIKEIQRSEREGSELSVITFAIDETTCRKLSPKDLSAVKIDVGKLLHNHLRLFDSYYAWEQDSFLIILPHTNSTQALKIANNLRHSARKSIVVNNETISTSQGVASLNVGDDGDSLTRRAQEALRQANQAGSNRSQLYKEAPQSEKNTASSAATKNIGDLLLRGKDHEN